MTPSVPQHKPARKQARMRSRDERVQVEISAGGVVYKRTPQGVRVAFVMDSYGKWTFAKGHVEKGESISDAALRETREEMGLGRLRLVAPLGSIDIWFRDRFRPETKGVLIHKYVHYFLMEAPSRAKGSAQPKAHTEKIVWVDMRRAMRILSYHDVRATLRKAIGILSARSDGSPRAPQHASRPDDMPSSRPAQPKSSDLKLS